MKEEAQAPDSKVAERPLDRHMTTQVAFLFPGQGSQAVGMGADIFESSPAARNVFETVDAALGFSLSDLCFNGPDDTLRATINAQPAIVTVSLALLASLQAALSPNSSDWSTPLVPAFTAGHSVGEYTALVASGALDLQSAVTLVRERGRLMHHEGTVCAGGMAAVIGSDEETLTSICQEASAQASKNVASETARNRHPGLGQVSVANFNAPGQIVISGEQSALEIAMEMAKSRGAKRVLPLSVSGAFHSPVMQPAAAGLAQALANTTIHQSTIPVIGNIHAQPLVGAEEIRSELAEQVASSVQWIKTIEYLTQAGVTTFIEIGPGQALSGMVKRISKGAKIMNISTAAEVEQVAQSIREMGLLREV